MIKKLLYTAVAALMLTGCSDDTWKPQLDKEGQLLLKGMDVEVVTTENLASRADVDVSSFIITLYNESKEVNGQWTYSSMPEILTLSTGKYTIEAKSHIVEKQAWEKPYYYGTLDFEIKENEITNLGTVVCKFSNIKVTITFDSELLEHITSNDSKVTVVANDQGSLDFGLNETRAGYFAAIDGSNTLVATFTGYIDGYEQTIPITYDNVEAGTYYQITYSVKTHESDIPEEGGKAEVSGITIETEIATTSEEGTIEITEGIIENPVDRPGQEDPDEPVNPGTDPQDPVSSNITFTSTGTIEVSFTEPNDVPKEGDGTTIITIASANKFAHLYVNISSTSTVFMEILPTVGFPPLESDGSLLFDLAYPGDYEEGYAGLDFPTGEKVMNATEIKFDISKFVPFLSMYNGTHKFKITVVDNEGESNSATLTYVY